MHTDTRELIYDRFIKPTKAERPSYIGIEIEMPVINLDTGVTDRRVSIDAMKKAIGHFGFQETKYDIEGNPHEAVCPSTGDVFSFDCSYNNFEISLGRVRTLHEAQARFRDYVAFLNEKLREQGHTLSGLGINPFYRKNEPNFVPSPRYKMLEGYLKKAEEWERDGGFHPYVSYPTFSSASQVQLDVHEENLIGVIEAFTLLEPIKALLFANSVMPQEPSYLCVRDMLWERSTHGINKRNVGFYDTRFEDIGELVDYISGASIFCAEREEKYLFFYPIPFEDYLETEQIRAWYYEDGEYRKTVFSPKESDIDHLRTYKFIDLTARGTLEFRSACTQPLSEVMTVAALHLGLMNRTDELKALLQNDRVIYHRGYTPHQLREIFNQRTLPDFADTNEIRALVTAVLTLAKEGLTERGFAEESYLAPLFKRARELSCPARRMAEAIQSGADVIDIIEEYAKLQVTL